MITQDITLWPNWRGNRGRVLINKLDQLLIFLSNILRMLALIVSAHPYCTRKFTCHAMHQARALNTKMNNDRADGHCLALLGFNDLGCLVIPTFLFRNRFYLQLSPHCIKMNTNSMWEVRKISRFLSMEHGILSSCSCKEHETYGR